MAKKKIKNKKKPYYIDFIETPLLRRKFNLFFVDSVVDAFRHKGKWHQTFYDLAEQEYDGNIKDTEQFLNTTTALVVMFHKKNMLSIILPKNANPGLIAHEVFHLALMICSYKGLKLTDSSEETYAYMIQWLMDEILKRQKLVKKFEKDCK